MPAYDAPLVRRLNSFFELTEDEAHLLASLPMTVKTLAADQDITRQGDSPTQSCLVLEGVVALYKITGPGRRQITSFYIPGDIPDLHNLHLNVLDSSLTTLTQCKVGFIQHDALRALFQENARIADALWRMTLIDAAVFREWIANIGQRDASTRLAHLICEMFLRFKAVGMTESDACDWPITQQELGDATGISVVHVNRMLQELRGDGLISLAHRKLKVANWPRLAKVGDFDPTYLHLNS